MKDYLLPLITALSGAFAGWFFERRHKQASLEQKMMRLYQELIDDLRKRYDEKFADLEKEIERLRHNVELWKHKYEVLKKEIEGNKKTP